MSSYQNDITSEVSTVLDALTKSILIIGSDHIQLGCIEIEHLTCTTCKYNTGEPFSHCQLAKYNLNKDFPIYKFIKENYPEYLI